MVPTMQLQLHLALLGLSQPGGAHCDANSGEVALIYSNPFREHGDGMLPVPIGGQALRAQASEPTESEPQ